MVEENSPSLVGDGAGDDMGAVWGDRLTEVWTSPTSAGTGLALGTQGVLTARHLITDASAGKKVWARIVRTHKQTGVWVEMTVAWQDPKWDLAVLEVDPQGSPGAWLTPRSANAVVVA